jgi:hypothetical protein
VITVASGETGEPFDAERRIDVRSYLAHSPPLAPAAADVEQAEPGNRLAFCPAELDPHDLVASADREDHRAAAGGRGQASARGQAARGQDLRQVLPAAEQVDVAVHGHLLVGIDLGDLDRDAAQPGPAGEHEQVPPVPVGAKQIRVNPDQPDG